MSRTFPASQRAASAHQLATDLQKEFVNRLTSLSADQRDRFAEIEWLRDEGRHGGGTRYGAASTPLMNRASVNVSSVHYDDDATKRLRSATAFSTIIHPRNPNAPSVHMHISWTEMRDDTGYWRVMADLNPSIDNPDAKQFFDQLLRDAAPRQYEAAAQQGNKYFYIPALARHRGVSHFYLEGYATADFQEDLAFARAFGGRVIDGYSQLVRDAIELTVGEAQRREQLAYHTVYLFQVLTLDRGTTSGLLVHDQNDVGILGSLPGYVDRSLLASWIDRVSSPQDQLLRAIVLTLPEQHPCPVTDSCRGILAGVVRRHYQEHPEALAMQAAGDVIPPTVSNHE